MHLGRILADTALRSPDTMASVLDEALAAGTRLGLDGGGVRRLAGPLWRAETQTEELNATVLASATLALTAPGAAA